MYDNLIHDFMTIEHIYSHFWLPNLSISMKSLVFVFGNHLVICSDNFSNAQMMFKHRAECDLSSVFEF